jgi:hypothetical protein
MEYVAALNQSYSFVKGRLVFEDGISYSLAEAIALNDPRLTPEDIQAIHLVKKMFDGEILAQPGEIHRFICNGIVEPFRGPRAESRGETALPAKSLDELANEMGPPPFLNKGENT